MPLHRSSPYSANACVFILAREKFKSESRNSLSEESYALFTTRLFALNVIRIFLLSRFSSTNVSLRCFTVLFLITFSFYRSLSLSLSLSLSFSCSGISIGLLDAAARLLYLLA
jgi:hypothetical protein